MTTADTTQNQKFSSLKADPTRAVARAVTAPLAAASRRPITLGGRIGQTLRELYYSSRVYQLTLRGRPAKLAFRPADLWQGDVDRANAMFQGTFRAAGDEVAAPNQSPWVIAPPSAAWLIEINSFDWLRDFRTAGGRAAKQRARDLTAGWIDACGTWSRLAWRPDIVGRRISAWTNHADYLLEDAPVGFAPRFLESLQIQTKHLRRTARRAPAGAPMIDALTGLACADIAAGHTGRHLAKVIQLLDHELTLQIAPDGGHFERNPTVHHRVLSALVSLRATFEQAGLEPSVALQTAIDRMAPMLRFFRHGDGALALFNGGLEGDRDAVDATLAAANAPGRPHLSASHSGYERISAGRLLVLMDVGVPPPLGVDDQAHAGCLAFEASAGHERLIVNCGTSQNLGGDWQRAMRASAAHSTVTVADTNLAELKADGTIGRRPTDVMVSRRENEDGNQLIEASHDGYARALGYHHHRRLVVDRAGEYIAGEDWLTASDGDPRKSQDQRFAARFHLHPSVRASAQQGGGAILLRSGKGTGWLFQTSGGELSLEESAYLGDGHPRRATQIVLSASISARAILSWALRRVD